MQDERKPRWQDDPELEAIRRRTLEELLGDPREPIESDTPDPVVAEIYSGASMRELSAARNDLGRARERYADAVRAARDAGLSWVEVGRVLGLSKQALHRQFSGLPPPPTP
jgi:2,4-dienoyl-CoA reductase-like NADH-dependent reductase (Old Yellow Enzyme family)